MASELKLALRGKLYQFGGSVGNLIPKELMEFAGLKVDDVITIAAMEGKKGKFIGIWKAE